HPGSPLVSSMPRHPPSASSRCPVGSLRATALTAHRRPTPDNVFSDNLREDSPGLRIPIDIGLLACYPWGELRLTRRLLPVGGRRSRVRRNRLTLPEDCPFQVCRLRLCTSWPARW